MKYQGKIVRLIGDGSYGFIFCKALNRRIFFHVADWHSENNPVVGDRVEFELGPSRTPGKPEMAVDVTPLETNAGVAALTTGGAE